ncbi:MAG: ABC transporter permease subunit [Acidobacteriota bacterium]
MSGTDAQTAFAARPAPTRMPAVPSALWVLFRLGARELAISKKTLVVMLLGAALVVLFLGARIMMTFGWIPTSQAGVIFGAVVTEAFVRFFLPVLSLFYGAAVVTDEIEGRTLTYLTTRPIDKRVILLGKFLAFVAVTVFLLETTLFFCWLVMATAPGPSGIVTHLHLLAKDGTATALGIFAYGAFFTYLGATMRRPAIPGLVFTFVWEQMASLIPGNIQRFTILHYLQSLTPHALSSDDTLLASIVTKEHPLVAVAALLAITALFCALAAAAFHGREYRLEK